VSASDPGIRATDPTEAELAEEDRRRSEVTVGEMAEADAAERRALRAAPPPVELRPMFPEAEDEDGRKRQ
jgi:hypothetical protein